MYIYTCIHIQICTALALLLAWHTYWSTHVVRCISWVFANEYMYLCIHVFLCVCVCVFVCVCVCVCVCSSLYGTGAAVGVAHVLEQSGCRAVSCSELQ